jgi:hypothetical protein
MVWALTVEGARLAGFGDIAYRVAVGTLVIAIILGYIAVRSVSDAPRQWDTASVSPLSGN